MEEGSKTLSKPGIITQKIGHSFSSSLKPAFRTIRWLLSLMLPVSFAVMLLDYSGILFWLASYTGPLVRMLGLRGESALVLISGGLLNIYSAIAVIQSIHFTPREITIMAVMCLIAHNLIVETAVQKKTGSSAIEMLGLRILAAIAGGLILNFVLPAESAVVSTHSLQHVPVPFLLMLRQWLYDSLHLIIKVILIIIGLNFLQRLMDDFSITQWLSGFMSPFLKFFGLPPQASFMWLIANIIGLAWGSAVLIEQTEQGKMTGREADILNHHIAVSHSLLEDTLLFMAIGVSLVWLVIPRMAMAFIVVWIYRLFFLRR